MKRINLFFLTLLAGLLMSVNAWGAQPQSGHYYIIKRYNVSSVLMYDDAGKVKVEEYASDKLVNQKYIWLCEANGTNTYTFKNVATGKYLRSYGVSTGGNGDEKCWTTTETVTETGTSGNNGGNGGNKLYVIKTSVDDVFTLSCNKQELGQDHAYANAGTSGFVKSWTCTSASNNPGSCWSFDEINKSNVTLEIRPSFVASSDTGTGDERAEMLVDASGTSTKWGKSWSSGNTAWITVQADNTILKAYDLFNANDTDTQPGRRWKNWKIEGSLDNATWTTIEAAADHDMITTNYAKNSYYILDNNTPYNYYKITINSNYGGGMIQMSDLKFQVISATLEVGKYYYLRSMRALNNYAYADNSNNIKIASKDATNTSFIWKLEKGYKLKNVGKGRYVNNINGWDGMGEQVVLDAEGADLSIITNSDGSFCIGKSETRTNYTFLHDDNYGKVVGWQAVTGATGSFWYIQEAPMKDVTIATSGLSSLCLPFDATLPTNTYAYAATAYENEKVTLTKVADAGGTIKAGVGYIIKGERNTQPTVTFLPASTSVTAPETNYLKGVLIPTDMSSMTEGYYIMKGGEFCPVTGGTLAANKAYLYVGGGAVKGFGFEDDPTAINEVDGSTFNDQGSNGKFLENGKIVIVKNNKKFNVAGQMIK